MRFLLPFSLVANVLLAGVVGYLLGTRASVPFAEQPLLTSALSQAVEPAVASGASPVLPKPAHAAPSAPAAPARHPAPVAPANADPVFAAGSGVGVAPSAYAVPVPTISNRSSAGVAGGSAPGAAPVESFAGDLGGGDASTSPQEIVQTHNPAGAGNSIAFQGVRVGLTETYDSPDGNGRAWGVELSPDPNGAAGNPGSETPDGLAAVASRDGGGAESGKRGQSGSGESKGNTTQPLANAPGSDGAVDDGMTYEDELFRVKWGWAAWDAARTEAKREADRRRHGGN